MTCKSCNTEIADNALIGYRCGTATQEPVARVCGDDRAESANVWMPLVWCSRWLFWRSQASF